MLYTRKNRASFNSGWRGKDGHWVRISLRTSSKKRAQEFAGMLDRLSQDHQWETLALLHSGAVQLGDAFAAFRHGNLANLAREAGTADLDPLVNEWEAVRSGQGVSIAHEYRRHVRTLIPEGKRFPVDRLTLPACQRWLDALPHQPSTRRKAAASLASFCAYLVKRGVIEENVGKRLERPKASKPRDLHLESEQVRSLLSVSEEPYQSAFAIAYGAGLEASVLVKLVRSDVDEKRREIRARGTKTAKRDRVVRCADWLWPWVEKLIRGKLPNAPLFPGLNRWTLTHKHGDAVAAIGLKGYRLHDARHYFAVRKARAGVPLQAIAAELGHSSIQMVATVYGVYAPNSSERDHWERVAEMADSERAGKEA